MKYLGINLTKDIEDVYTENYKILPREMKEDLNKEEIYHVHGVKGSKWLSVPPRLICRFKATIKISVIVFKLTN